jgi:hypothetical protein
VDFRIVEANPAFEVLSGFAGVVGLTLREAVRNEATAWIRTYHTVLTTGEAIRFERGLPTKGRKLEVYAFRIDDGARRGVGLIFTEPAGHVHGDALPDASAER